MCKLNQKKSIQNSEIFIEQRQEEVNNHANVMMEQRGEELNTQRKLANTTRAKALADIREKLELKREFEVDYKDIQLESAEKHLMQEEEYDKKIAEYDKQEKELLALEEKYGVKDEERAQEESAKKAGQDIFALYYANEHGQVKKMLEDVQEQREKLKQHLANGKMTIDQKLAQYKENASARRADRIRAVNEEFQGNKTMSSKGKKEKGRKKGRALAEKGVLGATEETYAMQADMKHCQKRIDSWNKKKNRVVEEDDIKLNGSEFDVVFKNKSGSALNIKAIMEKLDKLRVAVSRFSQIDETSPDYEVQKQSKDRYEKRYKLLHKVFRIVCAANGIDSETNECFTYEDDKQKEIIEKKIEYANAVYASGIEEYRQEVERLRAEEQNGVQGNEIANEIQEEVEERQVRKEEKTKEEILRDDYAGFKMRTDMMRQNANNQKVDDEVWYSALRMCSSYDHRQFEKEEDALGARKAALQKEIDLLSNVLQGNVKPILKTALEKLENLAKQNITIDSFFDNESVTANMEKYEELVSAVRLVIYAKNQMQDKKDLDVLLGSNSFGQTEFEMQKALAKLTVIGTKEGYESRFLENVNNMRACAPEQIGDQQWQLALELCRSKDSSRYTDSVEDFVQRKVDLQSDIAFLNGVMSGDTAVFWGTMQKQLQTLAEQGMTVDTYLQNENAGEESATQTRFEKILRLVFARKDAFEGEDGQNVLLESKLFGDTMSVVHKNLAKLAYLAEPAEKKARFIDNMEKMREKEAAELGEDAASNTMWEAAMKLCSSYDDTLYTNKDNLQKEQKTAMQKDVEFMSSVLKQDAKEVMEYAFDKLEELEQQDIVVTYCLDIKSINANPAGYEKLAAVIQLINTAREKLAGNRDTLNAFATGSRFKGSAAAFYKLLSKFNTIGDYGAYIEKAKRYETLPERQKKLLLADQKAMERKMGFIEDTYQNKWNETNVANAELTDLFAYDVDTDTQMARETMEPLYNENVSQLREYVTGLSEKLNGVKEESRIFELMVKVSEAAKMVVTGRILQDKYAKKVKSASELKEQREKVLSKEIGYTVNEMKKFEVVLKEVQGHLQKYSVETEECRLLREIIAEKDTMTDAQREKKVEAIMKLRPDSSMRKRFADYQTKLVNDETKDVKTAQQLMQKMETVFKNDAEKAINTCKEKYLRAKQGYYMASTPEQKEAAKAECMKLQEELYALGGDIQEEKTLEEIDQKEYKNIVSELNDLQKEMKKKEKTYKEDRAEADKLQKKIDARRTRALDAYIMELHKHLTDHEDKREAAYQKVKKIFDNQQQNGYDYLISHMSEEEVALYMKHRSGVVLETSENVDEMVEAATKELNEAMAELEGQYKEEELAKYQKMGIFRELKDAIASDQKIEYDLFSKFAVNLDKEKEKIKKNAAAIAKMEKTREEAEQVLKEAEGEVDYSEEAKLKSVEARKEFTKKCFTRVNETVTTKIAGLAVEKLTGEKRENALRKKAYSQRYAKYMEESEKLIEEKAKEFTESGVTYNTLALQDYLLDYSEAKYDEVALANELKQDFKKKDVYKLSQKDFSASFLKDGFATVNFQNLMYKRMMLIKWLDAHKADAQNEDPKLAWYEKVWESLRSPKQQRYDRRKERLEKLNRYLKLYCEANGIDFETGKLLCEMDGMTDEMVAEKVRTANLYLDECSEDIKNSYFTKEEEEEEEKEDEEDKKEEKEKTSFLDKAKDKADTIKKKIKEYTEFEKDIFGEKEEEEKTKLEFTEIYSIKKEWSGVGLQNEKDFRTAHFTGKLATKIGECKAAYKAGVGVGTIEDKETKTKNHTGGATLQAGVSFTALSSEFMAKYNKKLGGMDAEAKLEGKLEIGRAAADINATAMLRDQDGNFNPQLDFEAGAELALLKLEAAAGVKVYGIGIDAKLSFMLGLAAKAKGSMKNWKLSIELEGAIGIGFSAALTIDFGGLKDALAEHAKKAKCSVKDFVTRRMFMWGINMNSEAMQKLLLEDIEKLDLDLRMETLDKMSEGRIDDPEPVTT